MAPLRQGPLTGSHPRSAALLVPAGRASEGGCVMQFASGSALVTRIGFPLLPGSPGRCPAALAHLRGLTNYIARALLQAGGFKPRLQGPRSRPLTTSDGRWPRVLPSLSKWLASSTTRRSKSPGSGRSMPWRSGQAHPPVGGREGGAVRVGIGRAQGLLLASFVVWAWSSRSPWASRSSFLDPPTKSPPQQAKAEREEWPHEYEINDAAPQAVWHAVLEVAGD